MKRTLIKPAIIASAIGAIMLGSVSVAAQSQSTSQASEYRPGVSVDFLYRQDLEGVYHTDWYTRLEKRNGPWRDVYFETSEKFVNKGVLSFNCSNPQADIGVILYDTGTYGAATDRRVVRVRFADRKAWQQERLESLRGETPSYAVYQAAVRKYCR